VNLGVVSHIDRKVLMEVEEVHSPRDGMVAGQFAKFSAEGSAGFTAFRDSWIVGFYDDGGPLMGTLPMTD
jgi:hypothetical protein